jgi:hypothetical protein
MSFSFSLCPFCGSRREKINKSMPQEDKKMAKRKYYVLDKKGEIVSSDGSKRYSLLEGKALYEFLALPENKGRKFYSWNAAPKLRIGIEVSQEQFKECDSEKNRNSYVRDVERKLGISLWSIEKAAENEDEGDRYGKHLVDMKQDLEAMLIGAEEKAILQKALMSLTQDEKKIIIPLFFEKDMTERKLAERLGLKKTYLHMQKIKILKKIKTFF